MAVSRSGACEGIGVLANDLGKVLESAEPGRNVCAQVDEQAVVYPGLLPTIDLDGGLLVARSR